MIPQYIAAKAISEDIGKGDKGTVMPVIKIVNKQVKTSLIITGVVILAVASYVGGRALYWNVRKKKAEKKDEFKNAKTIYKLLEGYLPVKLQIWSYLNPVSGIPTLIKDAAISVWRSVKDVFTGAEDGIADNILSLGVYNVTELIYTYNGLYKRDLLKDILDVLGDERFNKIVEHWKKIDIENTGVGAYDSGVKVKQGNKINTYKIGINSEYADKYVLVIKNDSGKYLDNSAGMKLSDINFKKGNYVGKSSAFKIGTTRYDGGMIAQSGNKIGLQTFATIGGKQRIFYVPIGSVILFDSIADMNSYADSEKINITNVSV